MILAAGRGERMGPLTASRPKPLLKVGGKTLLDHQLDNLVAFGCETVVINVSYRGDMIRAAVRKRQGDPLQVIFSDEPDVLETAGGIIEALPWLDAEPFLVVNADVITDFDPARLQLNRGQLACLMMVPNPEHNPDGDFGMDREGRATLAEPRHTYGGLALFHPDFFADLSPGYRPLAPLLEAAIGEGQVGVVLHEGIWIDVGTAERLTVADRHLSARKY